MIFWKMNRWGQQTGCIGDAVEAVHKDELNGEDSLTLVLPTRALSKGDRVVWKDRWNAWHEHIVNEAALSHADGAELYTFYCENSIAETMTDYLAEVVCEEVSASVALDDVLAPTRWAKGTVDNLGTGTLYFFEGSAHSAIGKVLETWGGEYATAITVSGEGVTGRSLSVKSRRGDDTGKLFTYGHDMGSVEQTVGADDVVTRLHCFGKGTGYGDADAGYTERITFAEINDGKDYVEDNAAKLVWGLPDGSGGVKHAEGVAVFEDCEDEEELLALGRAELQERSHPHVSYRASVAVLSDYGYDYDDARTGDTVSLRDKTLDLRLQGRVTSVTRYLVNTGATVVELGDTVRSITDVMGDQTADLDWMRTRSGGWDAAAWSNAAWLDRFIGNLNEQMNATGGYVYWEQGIGITVYDRPVDQNPTMAIQLNGMGFRIANSKTSQGEWDWRTFGTGNGFVADEIIAGILHCGSNYLDLTNGVVHLEDGLITDGDGTNYWNLATGAFQTLTGIIGGFTIAATKLYSGLASWSTSGTAGVYLGTDAIATATALLRLVMKDGAIYGYQGNQLVGTISPTMTVVSAADPSQVVARGILVDGPAFGLMVNKLYVKDNDGSGNLVDALDRSIDKYLIMPNSWTAWRDFDASNDTPITLKMAEWKQREVKGVLVESDIDDTNYASYSFYTKGQLDRYLGGKANSSHTHSAGDVSGLATVATSGSYSDLSDKPTIPSAYTLPKASASTLGGVKVGSNLSIDSEGVLSGTANTTYSAGTGLSLSGTTFSAKKATASERGAIKASYSGGTLTIDLT